MAARVVTPVRDWLRPDGGPTLFALLMCWAGGLVFLALLAWLIESPLRSWWATCLGLAMLVSLGDRAWLAMRYRRWNDRAAPLCNVSSSASTSARIPSMFTCAPPALDSALTTPATA
jgi:hypothetical protein